MKTVISVGAFDAKNRLSELLESVKHGNEIVITKHNQPVARLMPAGARLSEERLHAGKELKKLRERYSLQGMSVRSLIDEGRP